MGGASYRKIMPVAAGLLVLFGCNQPTLAPPPPQQIARDAGDVVDATEIVALVPRTAAADQLVAQAATRGYGLLRRDRLNTLGFDQIVFRIPIGQTGPGAIAELEGIEPSSTVGVNHAYRLQATAGGRIYAPALLNWPDAGCPARMPVGIIDGTVDASAPALQAAEVIQRDFTGGHPGASQHGTAVAEVLAGSSGLTGARLYNAVVVSSSPEFDESAGVDTLMRAFDWLGQSGVKLVNVSLAGPYNKILDRGLQAADSRGMVVVAAAGNTGATAPPRYPAAFSQTIAVTAVDAALAPYADAPTGDHIDFAAPGVDIFVELGGQGRYLSGTSMAAPFVTSLIASGAPPRSAASARRSLSEDAVDLGQAGPDTTFGYGMPRLASSCGNR